MEWNGTERNGTERNGTEWNGIIVLFYFIAAFILLLVWFRMQ